MKIVPATVELKSGDCHVFEARDEQDNPVAVTWSLFHVGSKPWWSWATPESEKKRVVGDIDANTGAYAAPKRVFRPRRVAVLATRHPAPAASARDAGYAAQKAAADAARKFDTAQTTAADAAQKFEAAKAAAAAAQKAAKDAAQQAAADATKKAAADAAKDTADTAQRAADDASQKATEAQKAAETQKAAADAAQRAGAEAAKTADAAQQAAGDAAQKAAANAAQNAAAPASGGVQQPLSRSAAVQYAGAVIELNPARTWIPIFGAGHVLLFLFLLGLLICGWDRWWCPECGPRGVQVSPPVVTLGEGQAQQFVANVDVTWTNTVNGAGLYVAPSSITAEQLITITATSKSDAAQSAMAVVRLVPSGELGLTVVPSQVTVKAVPVENTDTKGKAGTTVMAGTTADFAALGLGVDQKQITWLSPAAGTITASNDNKATYTSPREPTRPQTVVVLAQAQIPARPESPGVPPRPAATLLAGALVTVAGTTTGPCELPGSPLWQLIALVAIMGAMGGLTHGVSSFGTYVGNDSLKASWLWWYALKPVLSALVAVIVFMVFRAGLGTPDLGLGTGECLTVAGFAALVGLFADQATLKLKDIFEALFTPRTDPRKDKAQESASNVPVIDRVDPKSIEKAKDNTIKISGKNFTDGSSVRVGGQSFSTSMRSGSELEVTIPKDTLAVQKHAVIVLGKDGKASNSEMIEVK